MATKTKKSKPVRAAKAKKAEMPPLTDHQLKEIQNELVIPYKNLRVTIGVLGIAMPFILYLGGKFIFRMGVQESISAYYHTGMGDVLVGILFALGVFLFSYKGYGQEDNLAGYLACFFAIGVALFPVLRRGETSAVWMNVSAAHHFFATSFFLTLTYFCLALFTRSKSKLSELPSMKRLRNTIYRVCGGIMLLCIVIMGTYLLAFDGTGPFLGLTNPIFWFETIAILAFGFSWFVKADVIFKDAEVPKPRIQWVPQQMNEK